MNLRNAGVSLETGRVQPFFLPLFHYYYFDEHLFIIYILVFHDDDEIKIKQN